jgi:phosphate uptake regulator
MFDWLQSLGASSPRLAEIHRHFKEMLQDGRHIFDAAANALLGGADPEVIREDLYATDKRINLTEQAVRREIVVHGSVHGASTFPALLVLMSLVKDAERIGDYAKNLFNVAAARVAFGDEAERELLVEVKDATSRLLVRAHALFEKQDEGAAAGYLKEVEVLQKRCDAAVLRLLHVTDRNAAVDVLTYRYFKRVVSHAGNIVTSVVLPVDKLDYYPGRPHSEQ